MYNLIDILVMSFTQTTMLSILVVVRKPPRQIAFALVGCLILSAVDS